MTDPEDSGTKPTKADEPSPTAPDEAKATSQPDVEAKAAKPKVQQPPPRRHEPPTQARGADSRSEREPAVSRPKRPGRAVAVLALLIALAAAGLSGYLFWLAWTGDAEARVEALVGTEISAVRGEASRREEAMRLALAAVTAELERVREALAEQQAALAGTRSALAEAMAARPVDGPPSPRQWKLAEVEYLLSVANHRLHLQRDASGAVALLERADESLADLDDFAFHDVRALLTTERLALRAFEDVDTQGLFLRLEATKGLLDRLPLRLPEYVAEDSEEQTAADVDESMIDSLLSRLGGLVRFRRHDGETIRPLLPPEQAEYLEQHLVLALERAQLALLRRDQRIYASSLQSARQWLHRFVDPERTAVVEALRELDALVAVDLGAELPDISGSLSLLRERRAERGDGTDDEADPE